MKKHYYNEDLLNICKDKHLTIDEIFLQIKVKFPDAGKSSIYRNVEDLAIKGELKKIEGIGKKAYFEKSKQEHIHLIDEKTGKITDLDLKDLNLKNIPDNFKIGNMDIKIFGEFV